MYDLSLKMVDKLPVDYIVPESAWLLLPCPYFIKDRSGQKLSIAVISGLAVGVLNLHFQSSKEFKIIYVAL